MAEILQRKNRIKEALALRGIKQVELREKTGIKKSALNNWLAQRWQPKQTPLFLMARALDVSELWLAGYDVPMERSVNQKKADALAEVLQTIRENERCFELVCQIIKLPEEQFVLIESMVKQLGGK